jgi:hypothetical protein
MSDVTTDSLSADDFFTGFFAALATRRFASVSRRPANFDSALALAFDDFKRWSEERKLYVGFRIRVHPLHQDSIAVRDGIASAVHRDLISLDNPADQNIRLKISEDEGDQLLSSLPGGRDLYDSLVSSFLKHYHEEAASLSPKTRPEIARKAANTRWSSVKK